MTQNFYIMKVSVIIFMLLAQLGIAQTQNPKLTHHLISECLHNCPIECKVISSNLTKNKFKVKLGVKLNCSVNNKSKIDYKYYNNTLNILVQEFHVDTISKGKDENGKEEIITWRGSAMCDCFFNVDLEFENFKNIPTTYLINGSTLEENDKSKGPHVVKENGYQKNGYLFNKGKEYLYFKIDSIVTSNSLIDSVKNQNMLLFVKIDSLGFIKNIDIQDNGKWYHNEKLYSEIKKLIYSLQPLNPVYLFNDDKTTVGYVNKNSIYIDFCESSHVYISYRYSGAYGKTLSKGEKSCHRCK